MSPHKLLHPRQCLYIQDANSRAVLLRGVSRKSLNKPGLHTRVSLYAGHRITVQCVGYVFKKHVHGLTPSSFCVCRTPTVTQYYCDVCGVFATSEEQLVMHNEGKKHKRTVALKELTEGHVRSGPSDAIAGGDAAQTGALPLCCNIGNCRGPGVLAQVTSLLGWPRL